MSFFKRSRSCKKGTSCCDAHLKKVNMVSSFCSSRDGLVTGRVVGFVGRDGDDDELMLNVLRCHLTY